MHADLSPSFAAVKAANCAEYAAVLDMHENNSTYYSGTIISKHSDNRKDTSKTKKYQVKGDLMCRNVLIIKVFGLDNGSFSTFYYN